MCSHEGGVRYNKKHCSSPVLVFAAKLSTRKRKQTPAGPDALCGCRLLVSEGPDPRLGLGA